MSRKGLQRATRDRSRPIVPAKLSAKGIDVPAARGLTAIRRDVHDRLPLTSALGWLDELVGLHEGGIYLLAGAPGGRKSGLATQIALDLGVQGIRTLTIMNEEAPERLLDRAVRMTSDWPQAQARHAISNMECESSVSDLEQLPGYLLRNVVGRGAPYGDVRLVILDSVQGDGIAANAAHKYHQLYEATRLCKRANICVILVGHVTKRNVLAGPRDLEHHVDATLRIERVADYRMLGICKNRYGPENPRGVPLLIDPQTTTLKPSPYTAPVTGIAKTFLSRDATDAEMQAQVALPAPGTRPQVQAPGLPRRRIEQIVSAITRVPVLGIEQLDLHIGAMLPGEMNFRSWLGLPLAIALIASCLRRPVPAGYIFIGEIDLTRSLRPLPPGVLDALSTSLMEGMLTGPAKLVVPASSALDLPTGTDIEVVPCSTLDAAVLSVWPDMR